MPISLDYIFILAIVFGSISLVLSYFGSKLSLSLAKKWDITDKPESNTNYKRQKTPIPLLGASGFIFVCTLLTGLLWVFRKYNVFGLENLLGQNLEVFRLFWVLFAIFILTVGGFLDDLYHLSAKWMFIPINLALLVAVGLGDLRITAISEPFNSWLFVSSFSQYFLAYLWIGFCLAATKFLDGHDGLVPSVGIIALLSIASVALLPNVAQPLIFLIAIIWACGIAGFLPFNFPNAKLYLGEGGSEIIGFMVGVLSILSGAKIATAGTVIGWFIYDIIFVILLRLIQKRSPFSGGREHWHYRLLALGLNKMQVLALTTLILLITATTGLLLGTEYKVYVLVGQGVFLFLVFLVGLLAKKRE